jgi:ketosteroid isomerase-like protein
MGLRDEVESFNSEFSKAVSNQDLDSVMDMYASDAWLLAPGVPLIQGAADIRTFLQSMLDAGVRALDLESAAVEGSGDLAVDIGRYRLTIAPPGADSMIDEGKYIVVLKRQADGKLRLAYDTFNSDQAPAG